MQALALMRIRMMIAPPIRFSINPSGCCGTTFDRDIVNTAAKPPNRRMTNRSTRNAAVLRQNPAQTSGTADMNSAATSRGSPMRSTNAFISSPPSMPSCRCAWRSS